MFIANKAKIIIAAISSRAYVQAAVDAGFDVVAIDAFCDVDTQKLALHTQQVSLNEYGFNATELLRALDELDLADCLGFCYGAGFEAQPQLLAEVVKRLPLLGNGVDVLRHSKNPKIFVELCGVYEMRTPQTTFRRPTNTLGWVSKQLGACGGTHIKPLLPLDLPNAMPVYYQRITEGTPISCLFLADSVHAEVIGFSEQWCAPTALAPYRYGGAVSHARLSQTCKNEITMFVRNVSYKMALRGINSIDFLVDDNFIFALEINPRLSATLDLYSAKRGDYFASHIAGCQVQLSEWPTVRGKSRAHHVMYAKQTTRVPGRMDWPDWVCDIPQPNQEVAAGAPFCTVTAEAHTADEAKEVVFARAASLREEFMLA